MGEGSHDFPCGQTYQDIRRRARPAADGGLARVQYIAAVPLRALFDQANHNQAAIAARGAGRVEACLSIIRTAASRRHG